MGSRSVLALRIETVLAGATLDALRPRFATLRDRRDNGTAPRGVSAHQLFQTPPAVAARLAALLALQPGSRVLEPSAGLGRILDALAPFAPREVVAVEMAPQIAAELFLQDRPGVTLLQRDFLTTTADDLGQFDAVAMNPPFHLRADIRHVLHALPMLKPGGRLAAVLLHGSERVRRLRPLATTWEVLPAGSFRAEGTMVETVLASFTA